MRGRRLHPPSPALVVAVLALFAALSGTAVAAGIVPVAKRALVADNAKKLGGETAAQVASAPGPASSISAIVAVKTAAWSLTANNGGDFTATCDPGARALAGGYDNPAGTVLALDTRPTAGDAAWSVYLANVSDTDSASGSVYVVCSK
jgi:hypothetical protein